MSNIMPVNERLFLADSRLSRHRFRDRLSDRSGRKLPVSYYDGGRQKTTQ